MFKMTIQTKGTTETEETILICKNSAVMEDRLCKKKIKNFYSNLMCNCSFNVKTYAIFNGLIMKSAPN